MPRSGSNPRPALQLTAQTVHMWLNYASEGLKNSQQQLNRMNIFPVADADTGTNMWQTVEAARLAVEANNPTDFVSALKVAAHAMLHEAKGNSGSILAQYVRGLAAAFEQAAEQVHSSPGPSFAAALQRANDRAWKAVFSPATGTILSVTEAAAHAVSRSGPATGDQESATGDPASAPGRVPGPAMASGREATDSLLGNVAESDLLQKYRDAFGAAREAVQKTATQLPALRGSGVVDAGAVAWLVTFEAFGRALGAHKVSMADLLTAVSSSTVVRTAQEIAGAVTGKSEVEIVARFAATAKQAHELRDRRGADSNSIVLIGSAPEWKIHLHTSVPEAVTADLQRAVEILDLVQEPLPHGQTPCHETAASTPREES